MQQDHLFRNSFLDFLPSRDFFRCFLPLLFRLDSYISSEELEEDDELTFFFFLPTDFFSFSFSGFSADLKPFSCASSLDSP